MVSIGQLFALSTVALVRYRGTSLHILHGQLPCTCATRTWGICVLSFCCLCWASLIFRGCHLIFVAVQLVTVKRLSCCVGSTRCHFPARVAIGSNDYTCHFLAILIISPLRLSCPIVFLEIVAVLPSGLSCPNVYRLH